MLGDVSFSLFFPNIPILGLGNIFCMGFHDALTRKTHRFLGLKPSFFKKAPSPFQKNVFPLPPSRLPCVAFFRSGLGLFSPCPGQPDKGGFFSVSKKRLNSVPMLKKFPRKFDFCLLSLSQLQQGQFFKLGKPVVGFIFAEEIVIPALFADLHIGQKCVKILIPMIVRK